MPDPDPSQDGAAWFRAELASLGETHGSLARLMKRCGDDRTPRNILRSIQRMGAGDVRVSGEMRVLLHVLAQARRRNAEEWSGRRGSNSRHSDWKSDALPAELRPPTMQGQDATRR